MTPPAQRVMRVFVVDDHELVRRALTDILNGCDDLELVGTAGTIEEASRAIHATNPDVALIDLRLPDGDGTELCRSLGVTRPRVRCLMHTSFPDEQAVVDAIAAGAAGYVLKDASIGDLVDAIRKVAAGQAMLDPAVTAGVMDRVKRSSEQIKKVDRLTGREHTILELLSEGLTNRQIAVRLHLAEQTIKNQVSGLLNKLGLQSRTQAAVFATKLPRDD